MNNHFLSRIAKNGWFYPALLIACIFASYFPVLGHDFQYYWDDQWQVFNHYTEGGWSFQNIWAIITEPYHGQYSSVNELIYLLIYTCFGYSPFWFHFSSLLFHAANALLIYIFIKRLLEVNKQFETEHKPAIAFLTALIFAIHPLNVETVAWISASKIVVYAFFYLLASLTFLKFLKNGNWIYYVLTLFLFACSFGGKEQAVSFPLWIALIYWIAGRSFKDRKVWLGMAPFLIMALIFGIITMAGGNLFSQESYPFWQRLVFACYSFAEYVLKSAFPFKLLYLYPFPSTIGDPLPGWLLCYPMLTGILLLAFWKQLITNRLLLFCLLTFLVHLAFSLHIISLPRFTVVADRYVYLSMISTGIYCAIFTDNASVEAENELKNCHSALDAAECPEEGEDRIRSYKPAEETKKTPKDAANESL